MNLDEELALTTPDINPVEVHTGISCPNHNFSIISVPRNAGEKSDYSFKCPLRNCLFGI